MNYQKRRLALGNTYSQTIFVIPSGSEAPRSHSVRYRFKPAADFGYLCGLHLADSVLVVLGAKSFLFHDPSQDKVWGEHTSLEQGAELGSLEVLALNQLGDFLASHTSEFNRIALSFGRDRNLELKLQEFITYNRRNRERSHSPLTLCDSRTLVGTQRVIKEISEVDHLREAAERSSRVHRLLMQQKLAGRTEREICNWIEAHFLLGGMQWTSYETIVGSGPRATTLHARATDRVIGAGELVLVDAGAEWSGYCADITRTLPAGGEFTAPQKQIYQLVHAAQTQALAAVRPGARLSEVHGAAAAVLTEGLIRLNLLQDGEPLKKWMPHLTSHWLGMDVHDPAPYVSDNGEEIRLREGMVFTVEPGLYFGEAAGVFTGIGVRIEDDVVVTKTGCEVLSSAPKDLGEIEELRARGA